MQYVCKMRKTTLKERKTEIGMNKREYQQKIDELENLIKIYRDHLGFEKSKSEGFKLIS